MKQGSYSLTEKILFAVCAVAIAGALFYLSIDDSNPNGRSGAHIGEVVELQNDVRFRSNHDLSWKKAKLKMNVLEGDQFFVGVKSSARIRLKTGEEILLQPNSMIALNTRNKDLELNLMIGSAQVKTQTLTTRDLVSQKKILLAAVHPPQILTLAEENFDPAPEPTVEFVELPDVPTLKASELYEEIETQKDNSIAEQTRPAPSLEEDVSAHEPAAVKVEERPKASWKPVSEITIGLDRATAKQRIEGRRDSLKISWSDDTGENYRVKIKRAESNRVVKTYTTKQATLETTELPPGRYRVLVESFSNRPGREPSSESEPLLEIPELEKLGAVKTTYPLKNQVILRSPGSVFAMPFRFQSDLGGGLVYQIELSSDPEFKSIAHKIEGQKEFVIRENLPDGEWFYRARALSQWAVSDWSETVNFTLVSQ